jgi:mannose-6-phosphate isomerase-like protein (cupin superfamily)
VKKLLLLSLIVAPLLLGQERTVDPTWLHRYVPDLSETKGDLSSANCHYKAIFGEGDSQNRLLRSVTRFGEITLNGRGSCSSALYAREEEIYFVREGKGILHYGDATFDLRAKDFTYLPPGVKHSISSDSEQPLSVVVMGFKIPESIAISSPAPSPKIANLDELKEEPVQGHPTSVSYKLMVGPRTGTRDRIDSAYVVTSLFWMDFAPGGTNFPHHHETAEEIYLVIEGQGEMVAGSGMDGIEGRYPAKTGDAYYFRPNCTVGFYNQSKPGSKAYILAVRSRISLPADAD